MIKIVPKHPEECPDHEYRRIIRPNDQRTVEVASEDGAFCPGCGQLQVLGKLKLASINQCSQCGLWFSFNRLVTITYHTIGTLPIDKEPPT